MVLNITASAIISRRWAGLAAAALTLTPLSARAESNSDIVEFHMYGRIGMSWNLNGVLVEGKRMNLLGRAIGGRFEEGDYLEPTITTHILRPKDAAKDPYVDFVITPSMFVRNGSFIGLLSNNADNTLAIELFQAYLEAGNVFVPGLKLWGGARFYRGTDVFIADNFFYNNRSAQGAGLMYKDFELATFIQTSLTDRLYAIDTNADQKPDLQRGRTTIAAGYSHPVPIAEKDSRLQYLAELHVLPSARRADTNELAPGDYGWVAGAKLHLDLGNGNFNDVSARYGGGIANGTQSYNAQTWFTFGLPDATGRYTGAYGIEVVDHFLWNFGKTLTLNAYAMLHTSQGGLDEVTPENKLLDFATGARTALYVTDEYHLLTELQYQGRRDGENPWGTLVKFTLAPTIVPSRERSYWARPHMRLIYTAGFYNEYAADNLMSQHLQVIGRTKSAHYIGVRNEWWF